MIFRIIYRPSLIKYEFFHINWLNRLIYSKHKNHPSTLCLTMQFARSINLIKQMIVSTCSNTSTALCNTNQKFISDPKNKTLSAQESIEARVRNWPIDIDPVYVRNGLNFVFIRHDQRWLKCWSQFQLTGRCVNCRQWVSLVSERSVRCLSSVYRWNISPTGTLWRVVHGGRTRSTDVGLSNRIFLYNWMKMWIIVCLVSTWFICGFFV